MDELFFALEHIFRITLIPVRCLDASGEIVLFNRGYEKKTDPFIQGDYGKCFIAAVNSRQAPLIEFENNNYAHGGLKDISECVIVYGPVTAFLPSQEEIGIYAKAHNVPEENFYLSTAGVSAMGSAIALLQLLRHNQTIQGNAFFTQENTSSERVAYEKDTYVAANKEDDIYRHSYNYEKLFLDQIKAGDIDGMKSGGRAKNADKYIGRMAQKPIKHFEYMICSAITLATRAAIEGGLDPGSAYALSDLYLQRLERCTEVDDIFKLHSEMSLNFTKHVHHVRQKRSETSYVEKCKVYIEQHMSTPFSLDDVANAVNLNKAHLSRLFSQAEKMSIMAYARKKRIDVSAGMLKYSDESIAKIASFLCFKSQSHFGKVFKDVMGTTPQKYRAAQQTIEIRTKSS